MKNKKRTSFLSLLIILVCISLCIGLTYAYFTDSATSSGNKVQAGTLKIDLELYDNANGWVSIKDSRDPVFYYENWEPGYVDVKLLKVENLGDLAVQWEAKLVSTEEVSAFANVIKVYVQTSNTEIAYPASREDAFAWSNVGVLNEFINTANKLTSGMFTAQGEAAYIGIALYMPAEIEDNTLQGKVLGAFDIQINATQYTYESDAFDEIYDKDAKLPCNHYVTETVVGRDATCSATGLTDGERCVACGEITVAQQPTSTIPHTAGEWLIDVEPTPDAEGSKYALCTVCGEEAAREAMQYSESIFTWSLNEDRKSYTVTGFKEGEETFNFTIPNTYNGFPVTDIGERAFYGIIVEHVIISDGIETIGNYAFAECPYPSYNYTTIEVPASVTTIGDYAFLKFGKTASTNVQARFDVWTVVFKYKGTTTQWYAITFGESWCQNMGTGCINCLDGDVSLPK